ncbi:ATP-binding cassette subfamily B protein [Trinickia symbiotica]|uniref:ATP-binding cassette domain-containing protein n=1 Tax=Trinickia symbiotica TaxID=863227 RepID=UPI000D4B725B|nr:ABC transporter ATP-binding protein [Trinickia symbiotica]PPK43191.1 ATP-binding cassette subfamily B protein [Trinickia symbiotica]
MASLFMALVTALYTLAPYLLRQATNALSAGDARHDSVSVLALAGAYGLAWTAARAFEWLKNIASATILARCDAAFHHAMYARLIRVEHARLIDQDPGTLVSVISRSTGAFSALTFTVFWVIAPTLFQLLLSGGVLWKLTSGAFALVFVASMFLLFLATWWLASLSKGAHTEIFGAADSLASHLVDKLAFALDIKVNAAYSREDALLRDLLGTYVRKISRGNARLSLLLAAQAVCAGLLLTVFTMATAQEVTTSSFQVGDFVMIGSYVIALTTPFTVLAASLSDLRRNHLALREGFGILELPLEQSTTKTVLRPQGNVVYRLQGVSISIAGRSILSNVDLEIRQGELAVVTGPSGSGKSTLIRLMLGLSSPDSGKVLLYGADVRNISVGDICKQVAVAPQNPLILSGTLRDNLGYGCSEAPSDTFLLELVELLELRELSCGDNDPILDLPLGIQGRSLSGGERQRIALGRALARCPSIVILDEPTSSLDPEREARIFARIRQRVSTLLVITHRLALLEDADRVYRLEDGVIEELSRQS